MFIGQDQQDASEAETLILEIEVKGIASIEWQTKQNLRKIIHRATHVADLQCIVWSELSAEKALSNNIGASAFQALTGKQTKVPQWLKQSSTRLATVGISNKVV